MGAIIVVVLGMGELGARLGVGMLCLVLYGIEGVVFVDAIFSGLAPDMVDDLFTGLDSSSYGLEEQLQQLLLQS